MHAPSPTRAHGHGGRESPDRLLWAAAGRFPAQLAAQVARAQSQLKANLLFQDGTTAACEVRAHAAAHAPTRTGPSLCAKATGAGRLIAGVTTHCTALGRCSQDIGRQLLVYGRRLPLAEVLCGAARRGTLLCKGHSLCPFELPRRTGPYAESRMLVAQVFARIDAVTPETVRRVASEVVRPTPPRLRLPKLRWCPWASPLLSETLFRLQIIVDREVAAASKGPLAYMPDYTFMRRRTYMLRY